MSLLLSLVNIQNVENVKTFFGGSQFIFEPVHLNPVELSPIAHGRSPCDPGSRPRKL